MFLPPSINGQIEQAADTVKLREAIKHFKEGDNSKTVKNVTLAAEGFAKSENWERLMECEDLLFEIEFSGSHSESVLPQIEFIHNNIPNHMIYEKAFSAYHIALIEERDGNIVSALKRFQEVITLLNDQEEPRIFSRALGNIGMIYIQFGDYSRARKYLNASNEVMKKIEDTDDYNINVFLLAKNAFHSEDYQESEAYYRIYMNLGPQYEEEIYTHLCELKIAKMELDSARLFLNLAKRWKEKNETPTRLFNSLDSKILSVEGDFEQALFYLLKSEPEIDSLKNFRERGIYYYQMADLFLKIEDWEQALNYYDKSLQSFSNFEINIDSIYELSNKKYLFHEIWIGDILMGLSKVFREKYRLLGNENLKRRSHECIEFTLESLDFKRSVFEDIESSIGLNKKSKKLYEEAIQTFLEWYEKSSDETNLDRAFQLAQRHNAFVLRQQINERTIMERFGVDDAIKKEYLGTKLQAIEEAFKLEKQYSLEGFEQLTRTELKMDSLKRFLIAQYPEFEEYQNDFSVTTIGGLQESLSNKKAVIKYFEGVENLYSFVITKNAVEYFVHENVKEISFDIQRLRTILTNFDYEQSKTDSLESQFLDLDFKLGKTILAQEIASLPEMIEELVIIPSGALTQIPFESLILEEKKDWNTPNNYLINDYIISYNYFCKALTSPTVHKELEKVLSYGLEYDEYTLNATKKISNDSISDQIIEKFRSDEMGHLYFAVDEAVEVAALFDGVSFTNENATKENFLSNVADYDIVHLSAHSFVDFQHPRNSAIIFTKKDSLADNLLQIKDVDQLFLDGQLFTLSACNTFFGKKNEGEGLSSMARAFIQSGASAVVGSFWSVPDEISKAFMVEFYTKMKSGMTKAEALRATKIDFMTNDDWSSPLYRSPVYWSTWVVYGDVRRFQSPNNKWLYLGIGLVCICLLLLVKYGPFQNLTRRHKFLFN